MLTINANAVKTAARRAKRSIRALPRQMLAPFTVTDNYGANLRCWTYAEALEWLAVSAPYAEIRHYRRGVVAVRRIPSKLEPIELICGPLPTATRAVA